jgi:AraC family transcriptional regulator
LATKLYREFKTIDESSPLVIEGLALEILGYGSKQPERSPNCPPFWLKRSRQFLHANFTGSVTLRDVAASAEVHPVHLARVFRQYYNCTVGEYVRRLRIEFASRELAQSERPLVDVAAAAGFSSQSHFSTVFKRYTNFTPAAYRATFRGR